MVEQGTDAAGSPATESPEPSLPETPELPIDEQVTEPGQDEQAPEPEAEVAVAPADPQPQVEPEVPAEPEAEPDAAPAAEPALEAEPAEPTQEATPPQADSLTQEPEEQPADSAPEQLPPAEPEPQPADPAQEQLPPAHPQPQPDPEPEPAPDQPAETDPDVSPAVEEATEKPRSRRRRSASRPAGPPAEPFGALTFSGGADDSQPEQLEGLAAEHEPPAEDASQSQDRPAARSRRATRPAMTVSFSAEPQAVAPVEPIAPIEVTTLALFQPPHPRRRRATSESGAGTRSAAGARDEGAQLVGDDGIEDDGPLLAAAELVGDIDPDDLEQLDVSEEGTPRRRRRRGGRRRRRGGGAEDGLDGEAPEEGGDLFGSEAYDGAEPYAAQEAGDDAAAGQGESDEDAGLDDGGPDDAGGKSRRRRRRRRAGLTEEMEDLSSDDPPNTVVKVRGSRARVVDSVVGLEGSTRIEAKRQRRRDGREAGRRRPPILTEAEFLARREAVNRVMAVRQRGDRTQIAVLEDGVLAEHYVSRNDSSSLVGNVYLGKVQNVLPSMEAAFVDIARGRNAVLYSGEVNWDAAGMEGQPKRIELALKAGDAVLVQATKDPIGHKGARLTSQISLPGRFLVYVPEGSMTGISRKLPDTERSRLKAILKSVMPDGAGVIVRTAAEGATEEQLTSDVRRLAAQWEDICRKAKSASAPSLLYGEPDLAIKVVRDIFNEDFNSLLVEGEDIFAMLTDYIGWVAPDLLPRMSLWVEPTDLFSTYRIDEQLAKALDRKVWLPSGGSLVIDRTEAMTVVDVNTGKFTGQGGNLEETVTRNNLEAAEEIVRQLRLRDIGGIIVVDFIDMVLESNRDLVLRRLVECLGRDRTKHQVAEVTSLGLVQMTRKRIGQGLLEVFATPCEACNGRGHIVHTEPIGMGLESAEGRRQENGGRRSGSRVRGRSAPLGGKQTGKTPPPPKLDAEGHVAHEGD